MLFTCLNQCFSAFEPGIFIIRSRRGSKYYCILSTLMPLRDNTLLPNGHDAVIVNMRCCFVLFFLALAQINILSYGNIFCHNRLFQNAVLTNLGLIHNNGIPHHSSLSYGNAASDNGIIYLSVYIRTFTDDTALHHTVFRKILRRLVSLLV